jgi:tetratricopeptide (TPR) repeat protein
MKNFICITALLLGILAADHALSQNTEADKLYREAVSKMDNENDYTGAIVLLDKAIKLEPKNLDYQYEKAYAYHRQGDFKSAANILEKLVKASKAQPLYFQLLGNTYNRMEENEKSDEIYQKGLKKFPDAGVLYAGRGIIDFNHKDYSNAVNWFEKGIEMAPDYKSDYFYAAILYKGSTETVWSVLYGEIFCNLDRSGKRFEIMSAALYETYDTCITFKDSSIAVSFTRNATITLDNLKNLKLPFANTVFEMNFLLNLVGEKEMSIATLNRVREKFIKMYYSKKQNIEYPNILFDYHKKLIDANYFDCYNYWLYYYGHKDEADTWISRNKERYDQFTTWFEKNPLEVSKEHRFYRAQYK